MKKCLILICLLAFTFAKAQTTHEFEVNFETASYHLSDPEAAKINTIIEMLPKAPESYKIMIVGHTDNVGNFEYNKVLSDNRASEIAGYFHKKGFRENNIKTVGKAYSEPIAANVSESGKSKNRRVKVFITAATPKVNDLGGLTLKEDHFKIDSQKEQVVHYKSGSKIRVPADAFVDKNGNTIKGEVDLSYVEYRNPVDFILGNIPMDFEKDHFNSAGMYKILAYKNGVPVFLKEGKNIDIDFPLESELAGLNFYNFDTISNKWTELSKLTKSATDPTEIDVAAFDFTIQQDTLLSLPGGITIFRSINNDTIYNGYGTIDNCWSANQMINEGIVLASSVASVIPAFLDEKEKREANRKKLQQDHQSNVLRNISNNTKTQRTIKALENKIKRNNLKIKRFSQLIQNPGPQKNTIAKTRYVGRLKIVSDSISARNKTFEDKINKLKNPVLDTLTITPEYLYPNRFYRFWKANADIMPKAETTMSTDQWFQYFDTHKPEMLQRYKDFDVTKFCTEEQQKAVIKQQQAINANNMANRAVRSLKISQLGIFNCDQIARLFNPVTIDAQYKTEDGTTIKPVFIYLVDSKINGILRYDGNYGYSPKHFAYSPYSQNTLLAFDGDGASYILNAADFSKFCQGESSVMLTMKKLENISDREQLSALF